MMCKVRTTCVVSWWWQWTVGEWWSQKWVPPSAELITQQSRAATLAWPNTQYCEAYESPWIGRWDVSTASLVPAQRSWLSSLILCRVHELTGRLVALVGGNFLYPELTENAPGEGGTSLLSLALWWCGGSQQCLTLEGSPRGKWKQAWATEDAPSSQTPTYLPGALSSGPNSSICSPSETVMGWYC